MFGQRSDGLCLVHLQYQLVKDLYSYHTVVDRPLQEGGGCESGRVGGGSTHSEKLANFIKNISEHKHLLVSIKPPIFSDTCYQLENKWS